MVIRSLIHECLLHYPCRTLLAWSLGFRSRNQLATLGQKPPLLIPVSTAPGDAVGRAHLCANMTAPERSAVVSRPRDQSQQLGNSTALGKSLDSGDDRRCCGGSSTQTRSIRVSHRGYNNTLRKEPRKLRVGSGGAVAYVSRPVDTEPRRNDCASQRTDL